VQAHLSEQGCACYPIGTIVKGEQKVAFSGSLSW
jgi:hypothetical protein